MADIKISQMTAGTPDENTLFEGALDGGGGVYNTRSVSASALATLFNTTIQYGGLTTSDDTIVGAINELAQGGGGASVIQLTMSQYTALPSADKMNGSIYKITDKALIYCLDEEYHAMLEITSADYAQLSSAEKNNGTLYVITDEETTASDISYDNTASGLTADDIQEAVDEVSSKVDDNTTAISNLNGLVKIVFSGNISKTLTANQNLGILGTEIIPAANMPSGYTVIGLLSSYSTNNSCIMYSYDASAVGTSGTFCFIKNNTTSNQSITVNYRILFMKSAYVS